jgi:hypothetical protein
MIAMLVEPSTSIADGEIVRIIVLDALFFHFFLLCSQVGDPIAEKDLNIQHFGRGTLPFFNSAYSSFGQEI